MTASTRLTRFLSDVSTEEINKQFGVYKQFLSEQERRAARDGLAETPMYSTQNPIFLCRTTCYGGFGSVEPYESMPAWLVDIRRRVELNVGVHNAYFNAAVIVCLAVDSDRVDWHRVSLPTSSDKLHRFALVTVDGPAQFEMRDKYNLNNAEASVRMDSGQLTLINPGGPVRHQWRVVPMDSAAVVPSSSRKRKSDTTESKASAPPPASWHIVFMNLPDPNDAVRREMVLALYRAFRYGAQLTDVLREPHLKLTLQVATGIDSGKRQMLLDELIPVKKEGQKIKK